MGLVYGCWCMSGVGVCMGLVYWGWCMGLVYGPIDGMAFKYISYSELIYVKGEQCGTKHTQAPTQDFELRGRLDTKNHTHFLALSSSLVNS